MHEFEQMAQREKLLKVDLSRAIMRREPAPLITSLRTLADEASSACLEAFTRYQTACLLLRYEREQA